MLARGLKEAGYQVVLVTAARFETFVTACSISFAPLTNDFLELMDTPCGKAALSGRHTLTSTVQIVREVRPMMRCLLDAQWTTAQGADAIICHPKAWAHALQDARACQVLLSGTRQSFVPVIWKGAERTFHSASSATTVTTKRSCPVLQSGIRTVAWRVPSALVLACWRTS